VIVTTTSTSTTSTSTTTSTTTTTTTTTTPSTVAVKSTKPQAAVKSTSRPLSSALTQKPAAGATQPGLNPKQQQSAKPPKTTINIDLLGPIDSIDYPHTKKVETNTKSESGEGGNGDVSSDGGDRGGSGETVIKENPINYGLMAASAAGGGTIVGIICIIVMFCKKKQNNEKNKISPFEDDFDL
jgi:hypothetical protein